MYNGIKEVIPLPDYELLLTFENKEKKKFDLKPYLNKGIFKELNKVDLFNTVKISFDTIQWDNNADLDPEFLYINSIPYIETLYLNV
ncbi:MAG: DUF2442 domain-containing protein [Candidatus Eremiobacterota bacterium]